MMSYPFIEFNPRIFFFTSLTLKKSFEFHISLLYYMFVLPLRVYTDIDSNFFLVVIKPNVSDDIFVDVLFF